MLWMVPPASATEDNRAGCDSCLMKVNNLDKPFSLVGTWLFTREDNPANKDPETDTSSWKLSRAPGSWKQAYSDGKNFKVGWLRGNFIFDKSLIGQEVVLLIDTYMGRTTIYLDGQEIYHRGDPHNMQRYYAVQAIPVRFKITQPRHVIAIRVDTILMVGVYQLPFQLRAYSPNDHTLAFASLWGGELRMIAAHVIVLFGLFFLLVYFKTRYLLYLIAAGACITIYPFYAYPGDIFLKFFPPETMLLFHYTGIGTMALFHYYFAQFFYKATPRLNYFHGVFIGLLCLLFTGLFISFNLDVFQIARSVMLLYSLLALAIPFGYFYIRGVLKKKKYALTMAVGAVFFVLTCIHDVLLALGKIDSIAMIFGGSLIATSAMLWVASNMFADTFLENKRINANLELIVAERTEQLRQSEERYRTILDVMADAYFEVDVAGNYTFVNDATCRHLGYPREELIGTSFRDQVVKDEIDKVYQAFGKIYTTCKPVRAISYKFLRKDETTGFGEMSGFPLQNQKGEIVGFRGVSRDITERKKMEEALMQSEEKHRTIIENIQDGYCEVDLAGNFTFFNDSTCEIYGYSREELMGMSHRHCADKENAKKVFEAFNEIYRTGLAGSLFDYEIIRKDGTRRQIEISASLRKDSSGNPIGFSGTVRDATERKRTEAALRQSEEKYRTILESIHESYFEVDLAGNFTFVNGSMCRLTGCSKEELLGMNHKQFTNEETAKEVYQAFNKVYTTGEPSKAFDWQVIRKDGVKLFIEASVTLQKDSSGKPTGFKGMIRDITERKQMEQQLSHMATHDTLTGLPNRLMFRQMLNQAIRSAQRHKWQLAVFFIDLDRFKAINDSRSRGRRPTAARDGHTV